MSQYFLVDTHSRTSALSHENNNFLFHYPISCSRMTIRPKIDFSVRKILCVRPFRSYFFFRFMEKVSVALKPKFAAAARSTRSGMSQHYSSSSRMVASSIHSSPVDVSSVDASSGSVFSIFTDFTRS